ncbi:MAG: flagellar hook-basal body complex protein FliE [Acidobacteria bacterium]|nr:MAG: flagellar hook-basal body complex protein FliE [Acidobacteriota bacterium]
MSDFSINAVDLSSAIANQQASRKPSEAGVDFGAVLQDAIQQVSALQNQAGDDVQKVLTGEITDIHSAMIAVQKADISFQMMMQVRNKIVSAYQEIMRMQV